MEQQTTIEASSTAEALAFAIDHNRGITDRIMRIEAIEAVITERRSDIKTIIDELVQGGLNKRAVKLALARRALLVSGELVAVDQSLGILCSMAPLGIQGDLFALRGEE